MDERIRAYDSESDLDAVMRMWLEVGWIDSADKKPALEAFLVASSAEVGVLDGDAECLVLWTPGSIRYQNTPLPLCAVNAVTTSLVGRKQGLASTMTARAIQQGAEAGHAVAVLGMFEQGFYDRIGFGTGSYDTEFSFDPAALKVEHVPYRRPVRLTSDDFGEVHAALARRMTSHGGVVLDVRGAVEGEFLIADKPYALGYRNEEGELTHFVFGRMKGEHGPWDVDAMAYQSGEQLLELLRLLRELGDQVHSIRMLEPPHVQLQVLLRDPWRERGRSRTSEHESQSRAVAWWQFRILDVASCVAARSWQGPPLAFNLTISDPVDSWLDAGWSGVGGDYMVSIGEKSEATRGHVSGLPTMTAGVGAFTRLWFGVGPATSLAVTDELDAPNDLLVALDDALLLPTPFPGMQF